jgi:hypothetical protein
MRAINKNDLPLHLTITRESGGFRYVISRSDGVVDRSSRVTFASAAAARAAGGPVFDGVHLRQR